jgi:hypothetical protein
VVQRSRLAPGTARSSSGRGAYLRRPPDAAEGGDSDRAAMLQQA